MDRVPDTINAADTRYCCRSGSRLAPAAPLIRRGGVITPASMPMPEPESDSRCVQVTCLLEAGKRTESMLKAEKKGEEEGHPVVEAKERGITPCSLHKRNIGREEKSIVVCANKTLLGEKDPFEAPYPVADGLLP